MKWKILISVLIVFAMAEIVNAGFPKRTIQSSDFYTEGNSIILNTTDDKLNITIAGIDVSVAATKGVVINNGGYPYIQFTVPNTAVANSLKNRNITINFTLDFYRNLYAGCNSDTENNITSCAYELDNEYVKIGKYYGLRKDYTVFIDNINNGGGIEQYAGAVTRIYNFSNPKFSVKVPLSSNIQKNTIIQIQDPVVSVTDCTNSSQDNTTLDLANNIQASGSCMNITHKNVTLDCHGFFINASKSTGGSAVNLTTSNSSTVRSCTLIQQSGIGNTFAIFGLNVGNVTIYNTSIGMGTTLASVGIQINFGNNISIHDNIINTTGAGINSGGAINITSIFSNYFKTNVAAGTSLSMTFTQGSMKYFNIYNNTIINVGSTGTINGIIDLRNCVLCSVHENNLYNNGSTNSLGIFVRANSKNVSIYNNNITSNNPRAQGIRFEGAGNLQTNHTIYNNNITLNSSGSIGIHLLDAVFNNTFTNNYIKSNGIAIIINGSGSAGVNKFNTSFNKFINNTIVECSNSASVTCASPYYQVVVTANATNNFFIDNNFNKSRIIFTYREEPNNDRSNLTLQWTLNLNVTNLSNNKAAIPNVEVSINDSFANNLFDGVTDSNGYITPFIATEMTMNGTVPELYDYTTTCQNITNLNLTCFGNLSISYNITPVYNSSKLNLSFTTNYTYALNFPAAAAAADTCSCPASGDWNILASDNCLISSNCNMQGNNVHVSGSGTVTITSRIFNYKYFFGRGSIFCNRNTGSGCFG